MTCPKSDGDVEPVDVDEQRPDQRRPSVLWCGKYPNDRTPLPPEVIGPLLAARQPQPA